MAPLLLYFIKCYWRLIPPKKRRSCIFKKSCSHFVFEITKRDGSIKGLRALLYRMKHCRSGYYIINGVAGKLLISARNQIFDQTEIAERIFEEEVSKEC